MKIHSKMLKSGEINTIYFNIYCVKITYMTVTQLWQCKHNVYKKYYKQSVHKNL